MEELLKKLVRVDRAIKYAPALNHICSDYLPTTIDRAHFLTQILFESGNLSVAVENLNYSAERLLKIFPQHFSNIEHARDFERNPRAIGNRVYANRNGNGPESSGDGFRFRGRGFIQVTFKANYRAFSAWIGNPDIMLHPGSVAKQYPVESAFWFWESRDLGRFVNNRGNSVIDYKSDLSEITYRVNGSRRSVEERFRVFKKVFAAMGLG